MLDTWANAWESAQLKSGIDANPLRKQRFTEIEMLRKFCLGKEYSSVESELRAPLTWRVKNNQGLKFRITHQIVISHLIVSGMHHEGHSMAISDFEGP